MRYLLLVLPITAACAADDSACERAQAHVAACFPDHANVATCDPATADQIAEMPCDELAEWGGKADNPFCFWTPWLCTGDSGSSGKTIEVAVEECGPGGLCPYVTSASCGLVTLHDSHDKQVAKGFTNGNGRLTFEGLAQGTYTVKVHKRDGSLARMMLSDYTDETGTAKVGVTLDGGDAPWARFNLETGSEEQITQCAGMRGNITVKDRHGQALDREAAEWNWLVELETEGAVVDRQRPIYFEPDENIVDFKLVPRGTHTLRFVRMDIPSYEQKPNPDYARLRRLYSTDEAPIEVNINVTASQFGQTTSVSRSIVDPLAP